jgi:ligand-binding sensor domain-containing protein
MKEMLYNDLVISTSLINDIFIPDTNSDMVLLATDNGIFISLDRGMHFKYFMDGLSATKIYTVTNYNGDIFAGTDNGIYFLKRDTWKFTGLGNRRIFSLKKYKEWLFAGTDDIVYKIEKGKPYEVFNAGSYIQKISVFNNNVFAATPIGVFNVNKEEKVLDLPSISLCANKCLYIGTSFGIRKSCNGTKFQKTGLDDGIIRAVAAKNNLLFGGSDSGLFISKDGGETFSKKLKNAHIFSLFIHFAYEDTLFVGTWGRGLIHYKFTASP